MELFKAIPEYLFIFANTEIYVKLFKTHYLDGDTLTMSWNLHRECSFLRTRNTGTLSYTVSYMFSFLSLNINKPWRDLRNLHHFRGSWEAWLVFVTILLLKCICLVFPNENGQKIAPNSFRVWVLKGVTGYVR